MAIDKTTRRTLSMLLVAAFLGRCVGFCSKPAKSWHASFIPTTLSQPAASVSIMEEKVSQRYLEDPSWFTLLLTTVNSSAKALKMSTLSAALGVWEQYLSEGLIPPTIDWPPEPLLNKISAVLLEMEIPSLCLRHPQLLSSVLRALLRLVSEYDEKLKSMRNHNRVEDEGYDDYDENDVSKYINENQCIDVHEEDSMSTGCPSPPPLSLCLPLHVAFIWAQGRGYM